MGKDNALVSDKQENGRGNSAPYKITPAVYVGKSRGGKPGKETSVHRLTFHRPLTSEQARAVKSFANETVGENKGRYSIRRGWPDKKAGDGSWLFRSEEDAKKAGEMISDAEAVADAQSLSKEEFRAAMGEPEAPSLDQKGSVPVNPENVQPEKAPMNSVDVEGLFNDLSTKGESKLGDYVAPMERERAPVKPEPKQAVGDLLMNQ